MMIVMRLSRLGIVGISLCVAGCATQSPVATIGSDAIVTDGPSTANITRNQTSSSASTYTTIQYDGAIAYMNDQGMVTYDRDAHTTLQSIVSSGSSTVQYKQLSMDIDGGSLRLRDVADELADRIHPVNTSMTIEGNDIILQPDFSHTMQTQDTLDGLSYIAIDQGTTSYRIRGESSRWSDSFFVIPESDRTLIHINRNPSNNRASLHYNKTLIDDFYIGTRWEAAREVAVTKNKKLTFSFPRKGEQTIDPKDETLIYHVIFDEGENDSDSCLSMMANPLVSLVSLQNYVQNQKIHLTSCKKIRPSGDERTLTTTNDDRQGIVIMTPGGMTLIPLYRDSYEVTAKPQYEASNYGDRGQYKIVFDTSFLLDEKSLLAQCKKIRPHCTYRPYRKELIIEPIPGVQYDETWTIQNIFGQKTDANRSYSIDKLDPSVTRQEVISNTSINILPRGGDFSDILLQYRNVPSFDITITPCAVGGSFVTDQGYLGKGAENYMFQCQGTGTVVPVSPQLADGEAFAYRKTYRTAVSLPDSIATGQAFVLQFTDLKGEEHAHYVAYSDIAIWTKVTGPELLLWSQYYVDGGRVSGSYTVRDLTGKVIATGPLAKTGPTRIDVGDQQRQRDRDGLLVTVMDDQESEGRLIAHKGGHDSIYTKNTSIGSNRGLTIDSYLDPYDVVSSSSTTKFWGTIPRRKIYAYPARGMYKPGDTVHVAGYIRDMRPIQHDTSYTNQKIVTRLQSPHSESSNQTITLTADAFGGFTGSFVLPGDTDLGSYTVAYELGDNYYSHNIGVQEYTKPTYSPNVSIADSDGVTLEIDPRYFFGKDVSSYDVQIVWSVGGDTNNCGYRCGRWSDTNTYQNTLLGDVTTTGGTITIHDQSGSLEHEILSANDLAKLLPGREIKITTIIRDLATDEVQSQTLYHTGDDDLVIALEGQLYDWLYRDGNGTDPREEKEIRGSVTDTKGQIDRLEYQVYYRSYDMQTQQGVDGNTYYIRKQPYQRIAGGRLRQSGDDFALPVGFIDKPGSYVVSIQGYDGDTLIVQNDKLISRYFRQEGRDILGSVPNNYTLTVQPTKPTYTIEDGYIELDLVPYVRGSKAIITVEQGQYVIDTIETTLDGDRIRIPLDKKYIPSVTVSVMVLQPTNLSDKQRKEPRFYAGYTSVDIDTEPQKLTIDITTEKKTYRPGEDVTLHITTTDYTGKPVDARVSVAVVDKALTYLYDRTKEPLKEFFSKIGTSVASYTNMKLLYQSLKAFANDGSKGGSGVGGESMFQYIRDNLIDEAYRNPAIYTRDGKASVTFTLPDNMTTWLVDTVAITTDTKLGTAATEFVTSQDVIVEGYMPRFLSLGDEIQVPYKIITTDTDERQPLSGRVWITDPSGKQTHEITTRTRDKKVENIVIPLSFPDEWRQLPSIQVHHEVSYGDDSDHVVQTVPLRTAGLIRHVGVSDRSDQGSLSLTIPQNTYATVALHASTTPTDIILPSIRSALWTESTYYAGVVIDQIAALHHLNQWSKVSDTKLDRYRDGRVLIHDSWYDVEDRLEVLVGALASLQESNGGIRSSYQWSSTIQSMYHRSLKAYMALLPSSSSTQSKTIIRQLEKFLTAYRADYPQARQLALATSAIYDGDLSGSERIKITESGYDAIVDYVRAVADKNTSITDTMRKLAIVPTNGKDSEGYGYGSTLLSTALLTQGAYRDDVSDVSFTNQLQSLVALVQDETLGRGYGGLGSLYARQTIVDAWEMLTPGKATCTATIDGDTSKHTITPGEPHMLTITSDDLSPTVSRSCDKPVVWHMTADYMPTTHDATQDRSSPHMTRMQQSIDRDSDDTYANTISRATDLAGLETIVSIHIPSTMLHTQAQKLIQSIEYSDSHCHPDHIEVRYDRVDLFYNTLKPGTCDITYPVQIGYSGAARTMPLQIREATRGLIRGSKTIGSK